MTTAEVWEMRSEGVNPCRLVKKYPKRKRERFLSDEEYGRLGTTLRGAEREAFVSRASMAAIRLLLLTFRHASLTRIRVRAERISSLS